MKKNKLEMSMLEAIEVKMGKTNELWTVKRWNKYKDGQFLNISVNEMGVSGDHFWSEHWLLMYADFKKKENCILLIYAIFWTYYMFLKFT